MELDADVDVHHRHVPISAQLRNESRTLRWPSMRVDRLFFTESDEANELLARDPFALLVGFALDQQVPVPVAFLGPLKLKQRLGSLEPRAVADADGQRLEQLFREPPAIHRFPGSMAKRVHELAQVVVDEYGGDASALWRDADGDELRERIGALPGFGEMKVKALGSVLAKRFGIAAAQDLVPNHPTLGDVDSPERLAEYQSWKRDYKAAQRASRS
jgi:uncharacterized HhH-GPD family protein